MSEETHTPTPPSEGKKRFDFSPSFAILAAGVLIAGAIVYVNLYPSDTAVYNGAPTASVNVPAPTDRDHWYGSPNAAVVLVEYSDLQCPYCRIVHPTLQRIVDESGGGVAWVYRHFPLTSIHQEARPAALAAECIAEQLGDGGFWQFANAIFADQSKMGGAYYRTLAVQFGADEAQFGSCVSSEKYGQKVDTESLDAQQNGGQGTPYTIVMAGGTQVPISGALPYAQIKSIVDSVR